MQGFALTQQQQGTSNPNPNHTPNYTQPSANSNNLKKRRMSSTTSVINYGSASNVNNKNNPKNSRKR
jgi:hypothetical protein